MRVDRKRPYAVVTGDVVGSSGLGVADRQRLVRVLHDGSRQLQTLCGDAMPLPVDVYSGDSWQLLLTTPAMALRAALFYRAWMVARMGISDLDTRAVIAIGQIDFVPGEKVSEGEGEAFRLSGRTLADMDESVRMRLVVAAASRCGWDVAVRALDAILRTELSPARARPLVGALMGLKHKKTAVLFPKNRVSQPNVSRLLGKVQWHTISYALEAFEREFAFATRTEITENGHKEKK